MASFTVTPEVLNRKGTLHPAPIKAPSATSRQGEYARWAQDQMVTVTPEDK